MNKRTSGFTVVELVIAIVFLAAAGTLFYIQRENIQAINRDTQRKTAINAMHYSLKEVYFVQNKAYPRTIDESKLKSMDPALLKDPNGRSVGAQDSDYRYLPSGCSGELCTGYMLRSRLERESDYVKEDKN